MFVRQISLWRFSELSDKNENQTAKTTSDELWWFGLPAVEWDYWTMHFRKSFRPSSKISSLWQIQPLGHWTVCSERSAQWRFILVCHYCTSARSAQQALYPQPFLQKAPQYIHACLNMQAQAQSPHQHTPSLNRLSHILGVADTGTQHHFQTLWKPPTDLSLLFGDSCGHTFHYV